MTEQITGVRQRETVPDQVVRSADQIELVDMSPQALRRRMAHGNIYTADKIDAALSRYFREGNLTALRELALLWLADRVDEGLERYREQHEIDSTWATRERIVVPVSGGPESSTLMRRAARIASRRSGGEWQALYVTRQDGLTGIAPDQLTRLAAKADELGGTFHTVVGDDPADAILAFARAENATQIVIGASRRGRVSTLLRPGVGERVVTGSGDIDVHIVTHDYVGRAQLQPAADTLGRRRRLIGLAFGVLAPALLSLVLHQTKDLHGLPIEAMSLMVVVVATALIGGIAAAVVSALVSALLLNYLFTPPLYTLTIAEPENVGDHRALRGRRHRGGDRRRHRGPSHGAGAGGPRRGGRPHGPGAQPADLERRHRRPAVLGLPALQCLGCGGRPPRRGRRGGGRRELRHAARVRRARRHGRRDRRPQHPGPGRRDAAGVRARPAQRVRRLRQGDGGAPRRDRWPSSSACG